MYVLKNQHFNDHIIIIKLFDNKLYIITIFSLLYLIIFSIIYLQLIDNCTSKLGLVSAARKLFFSDGTPIVDARQIEKDADVYVSCGEAFKDPYTTLKG
jgi:hypothetical protein